MSAPELPTPHIAVPPVIPDWLTAQQLDRVAEGTATPPNIAEIPDAATFKSWPDAQEAWTRWSQLLRGRNAISDADRAKILAIGAAAHRLQQGLPTINMDAIIQSRQRVDLTAAEGKRQARLEWLQQVLAEPGLIEALPTVPLSGHVAADKAMFISCLFRVPEAAKTLAQLRRAYIAHECRTLEWWGYLHGQERKAELLACLAANPTAEQIAAAEGEAAQLISVDPRKGTPAFERIAAARRQLLDRLYIESTKPAEAELLRIALQVAEAAQDDDMVEEIKHRIEAHRAVSGSPRTSLIESWLGLDVASETDVAMARQTLAEAKAKAAATVKPPPLSTPATKTRSGK